jgi:hypothetical protein
MRTHNKRAAPREEREHYIDLMLELLKGGTASTKSLCEQVGLPVSTGAKYANYMHRELRLIRHAWERKPFGPSEWELGTDPKLAPEAECTRKSVPAQQIGIKRDPLVAALFGPAPTHAKIDHLAV